MSAPEGRPAYNTAWHVANRDTQRSLDDHLDSLGLAWQDDRRVRVACLEAVVAALTAYVDPEVFARAVMVARADVGSLASALKSSEPHGRHEVGVPAQYRAPWWQDGAA